MNKADRALQLFSNNFNCSQAVFTAFATEEGIDEELALKLATSFGGGARNGEMCGAVSGALMVLGLKFGHINSEDDEQKHRAYSLTEEFTRRFKEKNNSIVCRDLLGYDLSKEEEFEIIASKGLCRTVCPLMVKDAVEILEEMIREQK